VGVRKVLCENRLLHIKRDKEAEESPGTRSGTVATKDSQLRSIDRESQRFQTSAELECVLHIKFVSLRLTQKSIEDIETTQCTPTLRHLSFATPAIHLTVRTAALKALPPISPDFTPFHLNAKVRLRSILSNTFVPIPTHTPQTTLTKYLSL
jgi:hypothetical protein